MKKTRSVKTDAEQLTRQHENLNHLSDQKVVSHVQRDVDDWVQHTVMLEGYDVPFKFRRRDRYLSLKGARVNLTYYPSAQNVAGVNFEVMNVVRIKRA